jgi:hypothetical protein
MLLDGTRPRNLPQNKLALKPRDESQIIVKCATASADKTKHSG